MKIEVVTGFLVFMGMALVWIWIDEPNLYHADFLMGITEDEHLQEAFRALNQHESAV